MHVCVCETRMSRRGHSQNMTKSLSPTFRFNPPRGMGCFSGTEIETNRYIDKRTDRQTDGRTIRLLNTPCKPFMPRHKNPTLYFVNTYCNPCEPIVSIAWWDDNRSSHISPRIPHIYHTSPASHPLDPSSCWHRNPVHTFYNTDPPALAWPWCTSWTGILCWIYGGFHS